MTEKITIEQALDYELRTNWLVPWISFDWGQELMGRYLAWKATRKHKKYIKSRAMQQRLCMLDQLTLKNEF